MATLNINRQIIDTHYRYKMPQLQIRNEGTKTILINLSAVGKALDRLPIYIVKFFGYEFSVSTREDAKQNRYSISGSYDVETLQNTLDKFIECFVLCPTCDNPETELILCGRKNDEVHKVCAACGHQGPDKMKSQKLTTYIAKYLHNTPSVKKKKSIFGERPVEVFHSDIPNDDFSENNQLTMLIEQKRVENKLNDIHTIEEILINIEQMNLTENAPFLIAKNLFTENLLKEIDEYKLLFQQLCKNNRQAQGYLLNALEFLINDHKQIRRHILEVFYKLYDDDIIEEETFLHWYDNPPNNLMDETTSQQIRQMAEKFIQWLNQPHTSDDEDSSNEQSEVID